MPETSRLSFSEELLWQMEQRGALPVAFLECPRNMAIVVRLDGSLVLGALRRSLDEVVRRHPQLRCRIVDTPGGPARVTLDPQPLDLPEIDLRHLPRADALDAARRAAADHIARPFDLASDTPLRAVLVLVDSRIHVLAIAVHHIVFDVGSLAVLVGELGELYGACATDSPPDLAPPAATYDAYVAWQRARLHGDAVQRLTSAWTARLGGVEDLRLPCDGAVLDRPGIAQTHAFTIAPDIVAPLRAASRMLHVTLAMSLLAAFATFLHRTMGTVDVLIGMPVSDRRRVEFERVVGLFTNVMVVRIQLAGRPTFRDLAARVRTALSDAYAQRDLPYAMYVKSRADATGLAPVAPFRVTYNFMNSRSELQLRLPGLVTEHWRGQPAPALADLALQAWDAGDQLLCRWSYNDALFSPARVEAFAGQLTTLARAAATAPDVAIDDLDVVGVRA